MNIYRYLIVVGMGCAALVHAQDAAPQTEHLTVPFADPSAPRKLEVTMEMANVTVRGVDRADAAIDYTIRGFLASQRRTPAPPPAGMHRIGNVGPLDVTQSNNVVRVSGGNFFGGLSDVTILVPTQTSVTIATAVGGKVTIENIAGNIEVNQVNGQIAITNASGPVVAHSTNGKIVASMSRLDANKSMSFSTYNGDIDLTLPSDAKATLKARADNGDIFTDFDVKLGAQTSAPQPPQPTQPPQPPQPPPANSSSRDQVRNQVRDQVRAAVKTARKQYGRGGLVEGTINGGGTEIQFTTFNGRILIHKN